MTTLTVTEVTQPNENELMIDIEGEVEATAAVFFEAEINDELDEYLNENK